MIGFDGYNGIHFNPRSPCGERLAVYNGTAKEKEISIHAPRVGSDELGAEVEKTNTISIHAPRVGSDDGYHAQRYPEQ